MKFKITGLVVISAIASANIAVANQPQQTMQDRIHSIMRSSITSYFNKYKDQEHFSGIGLAVGVGQLPIQSTFIGKVSRNKRAPAVTSKSLFQIGSITKSFTAVEILRLVAAGKLKLTDTVGQFLPQYKQWGAVTVEQLLNMTSGLPNYSDSPSWNYFESQNIKRKWSLSKLISFVYPKKKFNPPIKQGYYYTNTGYLLAEMIIEKVMHKPFGNLLRENILKPMKLTHTVYPLPQLSDKNRKNLMHGYGYNQYVNPELLGRDVRLNNLSWAASAGAMLANAPQIIEWVRDLFINHKLLTVQQQQQLTRMASVATGKPLAKTTAEDPKGFGLGVIQAFNSKTGRYWYYEGETLGFRAIYMYVPCNKIVIAATVNSATNGENDHIHELMVSTYQQLLQAYPQYQCKS